MGFVACHNDCHKDNWLVPKDEKEAPMIIDYECFSIDSAGMDLGVIISGMEPFPKEEEIKVIIHGYLK